MSGSVFDLASSSEGSVGDEVKERSSSTREELNIGLDDGPEFVMASEVENFNNRIDSRNAGHYSPLYGKVVIREGSIEMAKALGAHELEHARQAFRYPGFDEIIDDMHEVLEDTGMIYAISEDELPEEASDDFPSVRPTELLSDLRDLGYSPDSLATLISRNPRLSEHLEETSEDFPNNAKSASRKIAEIAQSIDFDVDTESENAPELDYSEERLNYLMDAIEEIEDRAPENGVMRTSDELIEGEKEGFAHFLTAYIEEDEYEEGGSFEITVERLENSEVYDNEIDELGVTVGERAAERVRELREVYGNLVEQGNMSEEEAIEYIMDRVQERKVEYAAEQMQDYKSIEDIEESLLV